MSDDLGPGVPFREVFAQAYGWTVDDDGYLWGLVAGDMGYEKTDAKLSDLMAAAWNAEDDRFRATGEKIWPVHEATMAFVAALAKATEPPASGIDAREGRNAQQSGAEHDSPSA